MPALVRFYLVILADLVFPPLSGLLFSVYSWVFSSEWSWTPVKVAIIGAVVICLADAVGFAVREIADYAMERRLLDGCDEDDT